MKFSQDLAVRKIDCKAPKQTKMVRTKPVTAVRLPAVTLEGRTANFDFNRQIQWIYVIGNQKRS